MGWKSVKDHYRIDHIVHVRNGHICVGSAYIPDLMVISGEGKLIKSYESLGRGNDDLRRYQQEMMDDPVLLTRLVKQQDAFGASITVWTYNNNSIIEKQCEEPGWPNVTHEGDLMYENLFSTDRTLVVGWAKNVTSLPSDSKNDQNKRVYASSRDRLDALPVVFSAAYLRRQLNWEANEATVYLNRWKERGWLALAGERSSIYYNLLKDKNALINGRPEASEMLYPSSMLVGPSVLHAEGWTTQIPQQLHVAVLTRPSLKKLYGVEFYPRTRQEYQRWQKVMEAEGLKTEMVYGLPSLPPALALVDAWSDPVGSWNPDPDDLSIDEEQLYQVARVALAMGVVPHSYWLTDRDFKKAWERASEPEFF